MKNKKMSNLFKVLNKGGKSGKRRGRFQNLSLADSDDDDDDDDDTTPTACIEDKDSGNQDSSQLTNEGTEITLTTSVDVACAQSKESDDNGVWQFVSEKDNEEATIDDSNSGDTLLVAEDKTLLVAQNDAIISAKDWKRGVGDGHEDADDHDDEDEDDFDEDEDATVQSVQTALMASPLRHRETGLLMQAIALGIEPIIPPIEEVKVEEPIVEDEKSLEEETDATSASGQEDLGITSAGWDYATALEGGDLTAHLKLICVPARICSSQVPATYLI